MTRQVVVINDTRLAVTPAHAAQLLDVSEDFFREHIQAEVAVVYVGRKRLIPVVELEKWLAANAGKTLA
jgi:excisionase family DNA binding protein